MRSVNSFYNSLSSAASQLRKYESKECVVIHHDEADGICSGTICRKMLEREGYSVRNLCLDKLFPEVVRDLHAGEGKIHVYADIGSAHAQLISSLNGSRNLVIILDHHDPSSPTDPMVQNINPGLHGMSGERDASASTVAYSFAKALNSENEELAYLAVIGTAEIPGPISALNKHALDDSIRRMQVRVKEVRSGKDVKVLCLGRPLSYRRVSTMLSVLGSVGYYRKGPEMGVEACLKGFDEKVTRTIERFEQERKEANRRMMDELRLNGLEQMSSIQWFHAGDNYGGMGGKVIGSFCSYLKYQRVVNPAKYLVGIMNIPKEIPGYGSLSKEYVKVSSRAPERLAKLIGRGSRPLLAKILPEACRRFGGFGDGHSVAASGVVLKGSEDGFVKELNMLAGEEVLLGGLDAFLRA